MPTVPAGRSASASARFDRFAEHASRVVSKAAFFLVSLSFVTIWLPTIAIFHSIDTWPLVINTVTSVLAFLLIALLQNSGRRYDEALHRKVDALAEGVAALLAERDHGRADLERAAELRDTIGLEKRAV